MAFQVELDMDRTVDLDCDFDTAFDFFSSVERMAKISPNAEKLDKLEQDGAYQWTMKKSGVGKYGMQVVYGVNYRFDKENGKVSWTPIQGIGNGQNWGDVTITPNGDALKIRFITKMILDIPFPKLAGPVIKPFVKKEFQSTLEQFNANVQSELSRS